MLKKKILMTKYDVIRVHVHDDGDIELQKHEYRLFLTSIYPGDLFYDMQQIADGRLDKELEEYGVDKKIAYKKIHEAITSEYGIIIEVK